MRFALRMAICCAALAAALWPAKAIGDEAALKRTAPDECIAWFSWAGFDALAEGGAKTNRTQQLLADEEVRAFLDSIAKNLGGAIEESSDENTKQMTQLARVLANRPAVAYVSRIAEVKRHAPPKAPEPPAATPAMPPQAAFVPATKVTIGDDGLERIGIDFDVEVTAGDLPAAPSAPAAIAPAVAEQLEVQVAPASPPRFGRSRTVIVNGKEHKEIEVIWPHGTEWHTIDFDHDLQAGPTKAANTEREVPAAEKKAPVVAEIVPLPATAQTAFDSARREIQAGFQANATPAAPHQTRSVPAPSASFEVDRHPTLIDLDAIVHETQSGRMMIAAGTNAEAALVAEPVCTACSTRTACEASTTVSIVHGAVVVDLGEHFAETKALYDKLIAESAEMPRQKIADVEFARLAWDQPMWLAFHDAYLILAFDEASAEQCVNGLAGKREVPEWLVDAEAKLPVERPAARLHVNIDSIAKLVDEPLETETKEFIKLLGFDQVSAISFVAGLDDQGTAIKTLIATRDGANVSAVLDIFGDKGLVADDLKAIPKDATMAAAGKIDVKKIVELGLKIAKLDDDEAESAWDASKKYLAENLFIDLSKDVVEALGDAWTLHYAPSEGGLMATTFTLAVRDEARLKATIEKLALLANADSEKPAVRRFAYRGQDVYYVAGAEAGLGSLSWCIRDGRIVASVMPQAIKAHIARGPLKETLADVPEVKRVLSAGGDSAKNYILSYTDTREILRWCYQYGSFLLPALGEALAETNETTFALHEIPSLAVIEQYFTPSITTLSRTDAGLLVDSRQTVPMMSGTFAVLVAAASFEHGLGEPLGVADVNGLVEAAAALAETPLSIGTAIDSCGPYPSPYWRGDDVQYFQPPADVLPPSLPPPPQGKPGPWSEPLPPGTTIPYDAATIPGQPYPPPLPPPAAPSTLRNVPAGKLFVPGTKPSAATAKPGAIPANPGTPIPAGKQPPNVPATYEAPRELGVPVPGNQKALQRFPVADSYAPQGVATLPPSFSPPPETIPPPATASSDAKQRPEPPPQVRRARRGWRR